MKDNIVYNHPDNQLYIKSEGDKIIIICSKENQQEQVEQQQQQQHQQQQADSSSSSSSSSFSSSCFSLINNKEIHFSRREDFEKERAYRKAEKGNYVLNFPLVGSSSILFLFYFYSISLLFCSI